ncbi:hypothetical protein, partial [Klebsiella aerogenes]|uniref:hypothetical protein n=1 Tax=Klebsiella aerogenes TaxID=548 RepID=UPI0019538098
HSSSSIALAMGSGWTAGRWPAVVFFAIVLIAVNAVYFTKGNLPLKYLIPGLVFLIVYKLLE